MPSGSCVSSHLPARPNKLLQKLHLQGRPAFTGRSLLSKADAVAIHSCQHQAVAGSPVMVGILRSNTAHGCDPFEKCRLAVKTDVVIEVGESEKTGDLLCIVHLQVDEDNVLQELGSKQVVAMLHKHKHSFNAGLGLYDASVAVLPIVDHRLPELFNHFTISQTSSTEAQTPRLLLCQDHRDSTEAYYGIQVLKMFIKVKCISGT